MYALLLGTSRKYFLSGVSKAGILNFTERDITGADVSSKDSGKAFHFFVFMKSSRDVSPDWYNRVFEKKRRQLVKKIELEENGLRLVWQDEFLLTT